LRGGGVERAVAAVDAANPESAGRLNLLLFEVVVQRLDALSIEQGLKMHVGAMAGGEILTVSPAKRADLRVATLGTSRAVVVPATTVEARLLFEITYDLV
jgi:hypothetical protein